MAYPNTGYKFKSLELDVDTDDFEHIEIAEDAALCGQAEAFDEENEMDVIFIFSIVLVKKVRLTFPKGKLT